MLTLSDYVMLASIEQPDPGAGGEEDSMETKPLEPAEPKGGTPPANQPIPSKLPPGFSLPDTARAHPDSSFSFPGGNAAVSESIGPASSVLPFPGGAAAPRTPAKTRRGIMGLHPIALLAGLIAFHIFVVTVAGK